MIEQSIYKGRVMDVLSATKARWAGESIRRPRSLQRPATDSTRRPRRFRPFAMVPPPASHNSGTAGGPARATVPVEPPHSTCPARAEGPRPPINQDQCEHHFTKLRQEPNGVVQVLLDQKAAGAPGKWQYGIK